MLIKKQPEPRPRGFCCIRLSPRVFVMVDPDDYEWLTKYHWRLVRSSSCFYAVCRVRRFDKIIEEKMHRVIAKTPPGMECHHRNHNTLDNRKANLQNLLPINHALAHAKNMRGGAARIPSKST